MLQGAFCTLNEILSPVYSHTCSCHLASKVSCVQNIEGNVLTDVMVSLIAYPLVAVQLHDEGEAGKKEGERKYVSPRLV